jgi:hypothetical protein
MSAKRVCLAGLVVTALGLGSARGQGPAPSYGPGDPGAAGPGASLLFRGLPPTAVPDSPGAAAGEDLRPAPGTYYGGPRSLETLGKSGQTEVTPPPAPVRTSLSDWILYPRPPGCCGPEGCNGPLAYEVYLRSGPSFNIGSGVFGHDLSTGWDIQGGARLLLFNPAVDAAWTVDFGVTNINNHSGDRSRVVNIRSLQDGGDPIPVTIRSLNRTFASGALGREWYLWGPAVAPGIETGTLPNLRAGVDVGGRWGTANMELFEIRHRTEVVTGVFFSAHSDLEFPCGCCILQAGVRLEYGYTWTDLLKPGDRGYLQDLGLLFTAGVRF